MVQLTINKLHKWSKRNGFLFSLEKTKCIHFSRTRGVHVNPTLHLGGRNLPFVESIRFLGMTLDHRLNWKEHMNSVKVNCLKSLNVFKFLSHASWGADRTTLMLLYRTLLRSKLEYGSFVYASARETYLRALNSVHNAALRLCTGAFMTSPVPSIYSDAGEPPLCYRRTWLLFSYV